MKNVITEKKKIELRLLLLLSMGLIDLYSCNGRGKKVAAGGVTYMNYTMREKDTTIVDIEGKRYTHLGSIADSLRTPDQQKLINAFNDVLLNGVVVEHNKEILKFSKEECLIRGLNEHYYDVLQKNIRKNNSYNKGSSNRNVAEMKANLDSMLRGMKK